MDTTRRLGKSQTATPSEVRNDPVMWLNSSGPPPLRPTTRFSPDAMSTICNSVRSTTMRPLSGAKKPPTTKNNRSARSGCSAEWKTYPVEGRRGACCHAGAAAVATADASPAVPTCNPSVETKVGVPGIRRAFTNSTSRASRCRGASSSLTQVPNDSGSPTPKLTPRPTQSRVSSHISSEISASCASGNRPCCSAQIAARAASVDAGSPRSDGTWRTTTVTPWSRAASRTAGAAVLQAGQS